VLNVNLATLYCRSPTSAGNARDSRSGNAELVLPTNGAFFLSLFAAAAAGSFLLLRPRSLSAIHGLGSSSSSSSPATKSLKAAFFYSRRSEIEREE
jgi:hypothetical protein